MGKFIQEASESSKIGGDLIAMGAFGLVIMILTALVGHFVSARRGGYAPRLGGGGNSTSARARTSPSIGNGPRMAAGYAFLLGALLIALFHESYLAWMRDHIHLSIPAAYAVGCFGVILIPALVFFAVFHLLGGFESECPRHH